MKRLRSCNPNTIKSRDRVLRLLFGRLLSTFVFILCYILRLLHFFSAITHFASPYSLTHASLEFSFILAAISHCLHNISRSFHVYILYTQPFLFIPTLSLIQSFFFSLVRTIFLCSFYDMPKAEILFTVLCCI